MSEVLRKVVIIGASGTVGSNILSALLSDTTTPFQITILSRTISTAKYPSHSSITHIHCDFALESLIPVLQGHDAIIHAASIGSLSAQPVLIEAATQAHVPRFILNEFANSPVNQVGLPELEPFRITKREVMAFAQQMSKEHEGFSWTALSTGNFLDYSLKKFPQFGIDIRNHKARLVDDGTERFSAVTLSDIGVAVRGILKRPKETKNRICHIRSVETCQLEILEALKAESGDQVWDVTYENSEDMYQRGKEAFSRGERSGRMDLLIAQLFAKGGGRSVVVDKTESDNTLLGVQEKDVQTVVRDVLRSFEEVNPNLKAM